MEIVTYSAFRQNLKSLVDRMIDRCEPLYIKRSRGEDLVVMSKSEYNSLQETLYLLSNPTNAKRLLDAIAEVKEGKTRPVTMDEIERMINEE